MPKPLIIRKYINSLENQVRGFICTLKKVMVTKKSHMVSYLQKAWTEFFNMSPYESRPRIKNLKFVNSFLGNSIVSRMFVYSSEMVTSPENIYKRTTNAGSTCLRRISDRKGKRKSNEEYKPSHEQSFFFSRTAFNCIIFSCKIASTK